MSIPSNANAVAVRSNTLRTESMYLDIESLPHLMGVLTNLYSDKILAVIREYSTNARDSNIAAGKGDVPIKVNVPTRLKPVFSVSDEGVGLSEEEVFNIYGGYGASTKRESNAFTGQLGLGCKSALTYASMFTLTATKNGVRGVYSVHKDVNGVPSISKLSETLTDATNGVTVEIPVRPEDVSDFNTKAASFFSYWSVPPTGLGTIPHIKEGALKLDDDLYLSESGYYGRRVPGAVVMGGVAYPFPQDYAESLSGVVVFAEVGDVDFTPSRESLHMTKKTTTFLTTLVERVTTRCREVVEQEISACDTYLSALSTISNRYTGIFSKYPISRKLQGTIPMFKGVPLNDFRVRRANHHGEVLFGSASSFTPSANSRVVVLEESTPEKSPNSYLIQRAVDYAKKHNAFVFIPVADGLPFHLFGETISKQDMYDDVRGLRKADKIEGRPSVYRLLDKTTGKVVVPEGSVYITEDDASVIHNKYGKRAPDELGVRTVYLVTKTVARKMEKSGKYINGVARAQSLLRQEVASVTDEDIKNSIRHILGDVKWGVSIRPEVRHTTGGGEALNLVRDFFFKRGGSKQFLVYAAALPEFKDALYKRASVMVESVKKALEEVKENYPVLCDDILAFQDYIDERTNA